MESEMWELELGGKVSGPDSDDDIEIEIMCGCEGVYLTKAEVERMLKMFDKEE